MPVEGTLVTTDAQTAGRGQRQRQWESEVGMNFTGSYILRPVFLTADRQFMLSAAVALAVYDTVRRYCVEEGESIYIKWPNDILIGNRKVAGILIENAVKGRVLDASIVGIGLNVNQRQFSKELYATSLALSTGNDMNLQTVTDELNQNLHHRYAQLRERDFSTLMDSYNRKLYGRGLLTDMKVSEEQHQVKILGAQDSGLLNLLHPDGSVTEHAHHELEWTALGRRP